MRGAAMASAALSMVGTPYVAGGRSTAGCDCAGLVACAVQRATGRRIDVPHVGTLPRPSLVRRLLERHSTRISPADARPGDVLLVASANLATHLAVAVPGGLVHADKRIGHVVRCAWPAPGSGRRVIGCHRLKVFGRG